MGEQDFVRTAKVFTESYKKGVEPHLRIVPDVLREREPVRRGKAPSSELSVQVLSGKTVFVEGKTSFGSIYNLAKSHNKRARTKKTNINGVIGTLVWLEDLEDESNIS